MCGNSMLELSYKINMREKFTQGTIIENMRSRKYPGLRCKGIVISARCDLAQDKINFFHCLMALSMEDWVFEVLFKDIIEEKKKDIFGKIKKYTEKMHIDFETLIHMGIDRAEIILTESANKNKKEKSDVENWLNSWKNLETVSCEYIDRKKKQEYMKKNATKLVERKIQQIHNSAYPKFAFVPIKAYSNGESSVDGLVVDLQDIVQLDIDLKDDILEYRYDYSVYKGNKAKEINKIFFFENQDDFVIADNIIESPWIEYVLQMFAHSFIRIGVDNAYDYEIKEYCHKIMEGR